MVLVETPEACSQNEKPIQYYYNYIHYFSVALTDHLPDKEEHHSTAKKVRTIIEMWYLLHDVAPQRWIVSIESHHGKVQKQGRYSHYDEKNCSWQYVRQR